MFEFTVANLERLGWRKEQAEIAVKMSPVERLVYIPIIGNAWSDAPLFQTYHDILSGPYSLDLKRAAWVKSGMTVGCYDDLILTDEELQERIKEHLALVA